MNKRTLCSPALPLREPCLLDAKAQMRAVPQRSNPQAMQLSVHIWISNNTGAACLCATCAFRNAAMYTGQSVELATALAMPAPQTQRVAQERSSAPAVASERRRRGGMHWRARSEGKAVGASSPRRSRHATAHMAPPGLLDTHGDQRCTPRAARDTEDGALCQDCSYPPPLPARTFPVPAVASCCRPWSTPCCPGTAPGAPGPPPGTPSGPARGAGHRWRGARHAAVGAVPKRAVGEAAREP